MEKGHKMPSDGAALKDKLAEFGLTFVGGWYSAELLKRSARDEFRAAKSHIAMTKGAGTDIFIVAETSNAIHGDRSKPLSQRPRLPAGGWKGYGDKISESGNSWRPKGSSSAIIITWERSFSRNATSTRSWPTPSRPCICCWTPAMHAGAAPSRGARARLSISRSCALQGRARGEDREATPATGASSIPFWAKARNSAFIPCRATGRSTMSRCSRT